MKTLLLCVFLAASAHAQDCQLLYIDANTSIVGCPCSNLSGMCLTLYNYGLNDFFLAATALNEARPITGVTEEGRPLPASKDAGDWLRGKAWAYFRALFDLQKPKP